MIAFLTQQEIDKARWDNCIRMADNSLIYAYSWYLDEIAPGWNGIVLNDYEAVMPVPTVKKIFTMAYQPFFAQQLGIFGKHMGEFNTADFINKIPAYYKYINICINEKNNSLPGGYQVTERNNSILYLHRAYEELYKGFTDHCKRNVKRAEKANAFLTACEPDEAVDFYIAHKGPQTDAVKPGHYKILKRVFHEAAKRNMLRSCKVESSSGEILAAAAYYIQPGRIIYQLGTANEQGREARAMYFLFNSLIKENCDQQMILDFEGSDITSIARFFNGFGALNAPYHRVIINRLPWPFNRLKK